MRIIFIALLATSLFSCSQKKGITTNTTETAKSAVETNSSQATASKAYNNECYSDRTVTKEVSGQVASIVNVLNQYMFAFENTRWQPCSVPQEYEVEGMKVKVSGEVLEIRPNERRAGTPFNIKKLEKM